MQLLLCYDNEGVYVNTHGRVSKNIVLQVFILFYFICLKIVIYLKETSINSMFIFHWNQWGEMPTSVAYIGTGQIMGWGNKAIEVIGYERSFRFGFLMLIEKFSFIIQIRSVETGHLDGVFMHKKAQRLKFLCERNDKVFFSSAKGASSCQIYFMTLNKPGMANWQMRQTNFCVQFQWHWAI